MVFSKEETLSVGQPAAVNRANHIHYRQVIY